jgi:FAD:protein FMN transferase
VSGVHVHSFAQMGTVVTIQVVGDNKERHSRSDREQSIGRCVRWFQQVEQICTRFDPSSEVMQLASTAGESVPVSAILFEVVQFAVAVAHETHGAFDPTIGLSMESLGFNENYQSGVKMRTSLDASTPVSYRDVMLDAASRSITLAKPLILDLGAVAKGLAIDMAARELAAFGNYAIDAGGDVYLAGHGADGERWSVGIRHPRDHDSLMETLHVSNAAVCTSGDYERRNSNGTHHIIDPRPGSSAAQLVSATVVAPSAMVADAFGTAAFVLGPIAGIRLLETHGLSGLLVNEALERFPTRDFPS